MSYTMKHQDGKFLMQMEENETTAYNEAPTFSFGLTIP